MPLLHLQASLAPIGPWEKHLNGPIQQILRFSLHKPANLMAVSWLKLSFSDFKSGVEIVHLDCLRIASLMEEMSHFLLRESLFTNRNVGKVHWIIRKWFIGLDFTGMYSFGEYASFSFVSFSVLYLVPQSFPGNMLGIT